MRFELEDLRAFVAVAELTSFRAAAEVIHLSQPALSRRIEKLEGALGCRLFDRSTHHVALTPLGRQFERSARLVLNELEAAVMSLPHTDPGAPLIEARIACVRSVIPKLIAPALAECRRRFPEIRVQLIDTGGNEVLQAVLHGEAHFGLSFVGRQAPDVDFKPIFSDPYVAICPGAHPLSQRKQITWSELLEYDYLALTRENGTRHLQDLALVSCGLRVKPLFEVRHISTLLALVESGVGVAAIPSIMWTERAHDMRAIPLVEPALTRDFGLLRRRAGTLAPAPQALYDFFIEHARGAG